MSAVTRRATLTGLVAGLMLAPGLAQAEPLGSSCSDCPSYRGAFSITNNTGVPIHYQVRWGSKHEWKSITLQSGYQETHSYPLGEDKHARVPTPYIRFDRIGGDGGAVTWQEYKMQFHAVGYAGYGPKKNTTEPKPYVFRYAADGRHLDLKAQ